MPNERDFRWMFITDFFGSEEELFPRLEGEIEKLLRSGEEFEIMKKPEELDELEMEDLLVYRREGAVRS